MNTISPMEKRALLVALFATMVLPGPAWAHGSAPVEQALTDFRTMCASGLLSPAAVLAKAEQVGWRTSGPDVPKSFNPASERLAPLGRGPFILRVDTEASKGERRDACGIYINVVTSGLAAAVHKWLGFPPSFAMGRSATYFAERNGDAWKPGLKTEFEQAKAQGRFYSIMVLDRGAEEPGEGPPAAILLLRVMPNAPPPGRANATH